MYFFDTDEWDICYISIFCSLNRYENDSIDIPELYVKLMF